MRNLLVVLAITLVGVFSSAYGQRTVEVTGTVTKSEYINMIGPSSIEWSVTIYITNYAPKPFCADTITTIWAAEGESGLQSNTTMSRPPYYFKIAQHKCDTLNFRTNGWTSKIISDAHGKPVFFTVNIHETNGKRRTLTAQLPPFSALPDEYETLIPDKNGRTKPPFPLLFLTASISYE